MLSSLSMGVVIGEKEAVVRFVSLGARLSCVFWAGRRVFARMFSEIAGAGVAKVRSCALVKHSRRRGVYRYW